MIIRLKLNEDHLKLIPFFYINEVSDEEIEISRNNLFNLNNRLLEDISMMLGLYDKAIENTKDDADGRAFDDETTQYMIDIYKYVNDNLYYIETLIHQYVVKGGISVGTYKALDNELIWEKCE